MRYPKGRAGDQKRRKGGGPDRAEEDRSRFRDLCFLPPLAWGGSCPEGEGSREGGTESGRESPETEAREDEGDLPPLRSLRTWWVRREESLSHKEGGQSTQNSHVLVGEQCAHARQRGWESSAALRCPQFPRICAILVAETGDRHEKSANSYEKKPLQLVKTRQKARDKVGRIINKLQQSKKTVKAVKERLYPKRDDHEAQASSDGNELTHAHRLLPVGEYRGGAWNDGTTSLCGRGS